MGCDVCLYTDTDSGYRYEPFYERTLTASKQHKCEECRHVIDRGERFHYATGFSEEGGWANHIVCLFCYAVMEAFMCSGIQYGGSLWEMMHEDAFPEMTLSTECFRKVPVEHRRELLARWWTWKASQSN